MQIIWEKPFRNSLWLFDSRNIPHTISKYLSVLSLKWAPQLFKLKSQKGRNLTCGALKSCCISSQCSHKEVSKLSYNNRNKYSPTSQIKLVAEVGTLLWRNLLHCFCILIALDIFYLVLQTPLSIPIFSVFVSKYSLSCKTSVLIWLHMQRYFIFLKKTM